MTRVERFADVGVNHSMTAHFHERPIVNWLHIGIPFRPESASPSDAAPRTDVTIVHAPTGTNVHEIAAARQRWLEAEHAKAVREAAIPTTDLPPAA